MIYQLPGHPLTITNMYEYLELYSHFCALYKNISCKYGIEIFFSFKHVGQIIFFSRYKLASFFLNLLFNRLFYAVLCIFHTLSRPSLHSSPPARCPRNWNWKDCKELWISNTLLALCLLVACLSLALQTLEVS